MGIDTIGRIKGRVSEYDILNYIKETIDPNATMDVKPNNYGSLEKFNFVEETYDNSGKWIIRSGFINFTSKAGNPRGLFYFYNNINSYENLDYYTPLGLENMVKSETTCLHFGCNEEAIEIMKDIVSQFGGGWIDENDCDSDPFYSIAEKDNKLDIPPVIHVTMKDIYEKFGGVVVIDDYHR